jgi:hypothetical protein
MWGCEFTKLKHDVRPIKTYKQVEELKSGTKEEFKIDPLTPTIEFMGSLAKGQQMWIQIVIRQSIKKYHSEATGKHVNFETFAEEYVKSVDAERFQPAVNFLQEQGRKYGVTTTPIIKIELGNSPSMENMPKPPQGGYNSLATLIWSLRLRWWAFKNASGSDKENNINDFYFSHLTFQSPLNDLYSHTNQSFYIWRVEPNTNYEVHAFHAKVNLA